MSQWCDTVELLAYDIDKFVREWVGDCSRVIEQGWGIENIFKNRNVGFLDHRPDEQQDNELQFAVDQSMIGDEAGVFDVDIRHQATIIGCKNIKKIPSSNWFVYE